MSQKLTPAQKQYLDLKAKYKDCILFFRMWDFYETFYEDAKICSRILDITLTTRDKNSPNPVPMAGVPYHSADKYIQKLVEAGYKVAIAEQIWEVKPGQIVERDVVAVVTPGTYLDDTRLKDYNFIAAITTEWKADDISRWFIRWNKWKDYNQKISDDKFRNESSDIFGFQSSDISFFLAFWDFSLWEYWTKQFHTLEDLQKFLMKIWPREIILDIDLISGVRNQISEWIKNFLKSFISVYDKPYDSYQFVKQLLNVEKLDSFGKALEWGKLEAFGLLLKYLSDTQKTNLKNIIKISLWTEEDKVYLDDITIRNLEIFKSSYEWNEKYSLYNVINKTLTPMWNRFLKQILVSPLRDRKILQKRLENIRYLIKLNDLSDLIENLKQVGDIQRLVTKILYKKNLPSLWLRLKNYLTPIIKIVNSGKYTRFINFPPGVEKIYKQINKILKDEITSDEIDFIKDWYSSRVDELREIAYHSDKLLLKYQQELIQYFWVPVKIKYVNNQWYFIEISKKDVPSVENKIDLKSNKFNLVRRQTLKSVERYTTTYLYEIENKILTAKDELQKLEKTILDELKKQLEEVIKDFYEFSNKIWELDVWQSELC